MRYEMERSRTPLIPRSRDEQVCNSLPGGRAKAGLLDGYDVDKPVRGMVRAYRLIVMALRDLLQTADRVAGEAAVLRGISLIVGAACVVFALALPAVYFGLQHARVQSDLRVEAVARARAVDALIRSEPQAWRQRTQELQAQLAERVLNSHEVELRIVDADGSALAASGYLVAPPQLVQRAPLQQAGVAVAVGHVEAVSTLFPLLLETAVVASLAALLGIMLYGLMKNVPLTALRRTVDQLRGETARAEQANAAKSAFLATMSHEIRTPMNGVIGMTGLLLGTPLNNEQREYVQTIRTSGSTLLTVINDVLDFSKMESGKMQLESQPFEISRCVEDVFSIVATAAQQKGLELLYLVEPDVPPWMEGDVTRLRQVLVNLVNNGVKFTERGEIFVHVSRRGGAASQHEIEFAVKDSGIGIPAAAQSVLFQPFSQVDASAARKYEGTGLGLAICNRLVKLMGGDIAVASEFGKGSTFTFTVRAPAAPAAAQDTRPDQFAIKGKHLLLVDDNETILRILSTVTRRWGLTCDVASSPQQALELLRGTTVYDLAILDYHMPEMDGAALAREIRAIPARAALPLTLFTAVEGAATPGGADDPLFAARLTKPLRQSQLFETLNTLFGGQVVQRRTTQRQELTAQQRELRSRLKLLVAEDNPVNMRLVNVMLDKLGYRADTVGSGVEAVQALAQRGYDLVLMDVQMPDMDGVEATRRIRAASKPGTQPYIIAVTANVLYEDRQSYLQAGMNGFLGKPFTMEDLEVVLNEATRALGGTNAEPAPAAAAKPSAVQLLDRERYDEIKSITEEAGPGVFMDLVQGVEAELKAFDAGLAGWMAQADAQAMVRAAHSLKGSSHSLGAQALGNLFTEIEKLAKVGQIVEASRVYTGGRDICKDSVAALRQPDAAG